MVINSWNQSGVMVKSMQGKEKKYTWLEISGNLAGLGDAEFLLDECMYLSYQILNLGHLFSEKRV